MNKAKHNTLYTELHFEPLPQGPGDEESIL